jgi:hypothetical protein
MSAELLMRYMYPVICTPSKPGEEFILSEHAYALHEGPTIPDLAMIEYHLVCVVAPRLALLLRSTLLPEADEDRDEVVKKKKEKNLARCLQQFPDSSEATSMFHDLPVTKPQRKDIKACSSPTIQNDRGVTSDMPSFRGFSLALFGLDSKAIQNINSLILDNASDLSMIVFRERSALRLALEFYLTRPICTDYDGMKTVGRGANDPTLAYLRKLEHAARKLGSTTTAVYEFSETMMVNPRTFSVNWVLARFSSTGEPVRLAKLSLTRSPTTCTALGMPKLLKALKPRLMVQALDLLSMCTKICGRP